MVFGRLARALPALAAAVALAGCVTIGPGASPTVQPTAAPSASPAPTATMTGAPTLPPTAPPTAPTTATPTGPPTAPPTEPPTAPPTTEPTAPPADTQLDPNQTARYGSLDPLESGFLPDPISVAVVSGGPIDTRYLGGGCLGFAEPNPDYEVRYVAGSAALLRFYFVSDTPGEDATLIINDSTSAWVCRDDSFGSTNPTVDFAAPSGGWYDIWVGSYSADVFISGTLYITELDSNHP